MLQVQWQNSHFFPCFNKALGYQSNVLIPVKGCAKCQIPYWNYFLANSFVKCRDNFFHSLFTYFLFGLHSFVSFMMLILFFFSWENLSWKTPEIKSIYHSDHSEIMPLSPKSRHSKSRLYPRDPRGTLHKLPGAQRGCWALGDRSARTAESAHREQGSWWLVVSTGDECMCQGSCARLVGNWNAGSKTSSVKCSQWWRVQGHGSGWAVVGDEMRGGWRRGVEGIVSAQEVVSWSSEIWNISTCGVTWGLASVIWIVSVE